VERNQWAHKWSSVCLRMQTSPWQMLMLTCAGCGLRQNSAQKTFPTERSLVHNALMGPGSWPDTATQLCVWLLIMSTSSAYNDFLCANCKFNSIKLAANCPKKAILSRMWVCVCVLCWAVCLGCSVALISNEGNLHRTKQINKDGELACCGNGDHF